jgi:hypothetical protein
VELAVAVASGGSAGAVVVAVAAGCGVPVAAGTVAGGFVVGAGGLGAVWASGMGWTVSKEPPAELVEAVARAIWGPEAADHPTLEVGARAAIAAWVRRE